MQLVRVKLLIFKSCDFLFTQADGGIYADTISVLISFCAFRCERVDEHENNRLYEVGQSGNAGLLCPAIHAHVLGAQIFQPFPRRPQRSGLAMMS